MKYEFNFTDTSIKLNRLVVPKTWYIDQESNVDRVIICNVFYPLLTLIKCPIKEISLNGAAYDSIEKLSEALTPILFKEGRADGSVGGSDDWSRTGNSGTDPEKNFMGTIDEKDLVFKTHNLERFILTKDGKYIFKNINASTPTSEGNPLGVDKNGEIITVNSSSGVKPLNNTAIGDGALAANETSPDNSAFGFKALNKLKTGDMNTAAGAGAAANVVDSINSTVVGAYAAPSTNNLNYDTFIGAGVGWLWNGGTYGSLTVPGVIRKSGNNVIVGNFAGAYTYRGFGNVIIGDECGYNFKNYGDYNVMIGKGITRERQYAGDCSVFIGNYFPNGYFGTYVSNKFGIHSQPPIAEGGEGPYAIPTVYGDFKERTVGIGGKLSLNPQYNPNVDNDETFVQTKIVVGNDSGQLAFKTDTGWKIPEAILNDIINYGDPYQTVRFRRQGDLVIIEGVVKGTPTIPENVVLFSLPEGFRPKTNRIFGTKDHNIIVEKSGHVRATNFNQELTTLDHIQFYIN